MSLHRRVLPTIAVAVAVAAWIALPIPAEAEPNTESGKTTVTKLEAWQHLRQLVGHWEGTGKGKPGVSRITCSYEMILQDQYLRGVTKSVFEAAEGEAAGETHEDWAIFSYDAGRSKIIMRQFNSEGFVNLFVMDSLSDDGKIMVMTTESSENAPPTLKARTTYTFVSDDDIHERFELAFDGKTFAPCVTTELKRKK